MYVALIVRNFLCGMETTMNSRTALNQAIVAAVALLSYQGTFAADIVHTESSYSDGLTYQSSTHRFTAENIVFDNDRKAATIRANTGGKVYVGDNTKTVTINNNSKDAYAAVLAVANGATGNFVKVQASDSIIIKSASYGLWGQSNKDDIVRNENSSLISLSAKNISIEAKKQAIIAFSNSRVDIEGENIYLSSEANSLIETRGNSVVNINSNGTAKKVVLKGDLAFATPGNKYQSGDKINSYVTINLAGADSSWEGSVVRSYPDYLKNQADKLSVQGLKLSLSDGAQWTPSKVTSTAEPTEKDGVTWTQYGEAQNINSLTLDNGVVNLNDASQTLVVEKIAGKGGTINIATTTNDGTTLNTASLKATTGTVEKLNVSLTGIDADDISDADSALASAAGAVSAGTSKTTVTIKEGAVNGAITADTTGGTVKSVTTTENTKLAAFNSVSSMATMAWRHDMNDLTKRMGELRDSPEGIGSWVRFYGSEQEYGRQNVTSKSTSVQLGSDYDIGSGWKVGGAFTYTDGTSKYDNGSSDNKAYGVAVYGSWLADNGAFVDLIGKYSRLSSDFELSSMDGKSKNNALSASVEAGWHIPFAELAFVEPQAELTYGVVLGDDFTTSNGVKISQEDTEALIGRVGVRTGFHFPNKKGTVYARASVLHDFKGESEFTASLVDDASVRSTMKDDIGGTYYEIGVGANFNWTDNAYSYVDLEKQNGGDVKENWRWNVGFRYVW